MLEDGKPCWEATRSCANHSQIHSRLSDDFASGDRMAQRKNSDYQKFTW